MKALIAVSQDSWLGSNLEILPVSPFPIEIRNLAGKHLISGLGATLYGTKVFAVASSLRDCRSPHEHMVETQEAATRDSAIEYL